MCKRKPNPCILFFPSSLTFFHLLASIYFPVDVFQTMVFPQTEPILFCVWILSSNLQLCFSFILKLVYVFGSFLSSLSHQKKSLLTLFFPVYSLGLSPVCWFSFPWSPCVTPFCSSVALVWLEDICSQLLYHFPPCLSSVRADGKCCISPFPSPTTPFLSCFSFLCSSVKNA